MTITLDQLLLSADLGLTHLAGPDPAEVEIDWAHVSELLDPTGWIRPDTLLLTTGLQLPEAGGEVDGYCARLSRAGVRAVAISVGGSLTHDCVPAPLVEAADAHGVTLLHVPFRTPLEVIAREVAGIQERRRNESLVHAIDAQRRLTASAIRPGGLSGPLDELQRTIGGWAVVLDRLGRVIAASGPVETEAALRRLSSPIDRLRRSDQPVGLTDEGEDGFAYLTSIGVPGMVRGVLVVGGRAARLGADERLLVTSAVSLLALELERRHVAEAPRRQSLARLVNRVAEEQMTAEQFAERLAAHGLEARELLAVKLEISSGRDAAADAVVVADQVVERLAIEELRVIAAPFHSKVRMLVLDPPADAIDRLRVSLADWTVGVGDRHAPGNAMLAFRQAARALATAEARGIPFVALGAQDGRRALLDLADPSTLSGYADAVLIALDVADAQLRAPALVPTLKAYLDTGRNMEATAALLRVHRHTVRQRLARIEQIAGRDLADSHDRLELWLAVELRDIVGADAV